MIYKQILALNKSKLQAHVGEAKLHSASPQCSSVTPLRMSYSVGARSCSSRQAGGAVPGQSHTQQQDHELNSAAAYACLDPAELVRHFHSCWRAAGKAAQSGSSHLAGWRAQVGACPAAVQAHGKHVGQLDGGNGASCTRKQEGTRREAATVQTGSGVPVLVPAAIHSAVALLTIHSLFSRPPDSRWASRITSCERSRAPSNTSASTQPSSSATPPGRGTKMGSWA